MHTTLFAQAQNTPQDVQQRLRTYLETYSPQTGMGLSTLHYYKVDTLRRTMEIHATKAFGSQLFQTLLRDKIYQGVRKLLPDSLKTYKLTIYAGDYTIDSLIPNFYRVDKDESRLWNRVNYTDRPWVWNISKPLSISQGLRGVHLSLWASHGVYFDRRSGWQWQRPPLYATREDFLSQSFVQPYIIPMLENAGAVVFTPRERDLQRHEVIVDNDTTQTPGVYSEHGNDGKEWATALRPGFAWRHPVYFDNMNPFTDGTCRSISTTYSQEKEATATWQPDIPEEGRYAVYVSYQTYHNSVDDALYIVRHKGGETRFRVNQRMGGGTWVYLGTFEFGKGCSPEGSVILSNQSRLSNGIVTADAVRFGGGMGNVARGNSLENADTSGRPRYLEASRYYAQWAGMPYEVYSKYEGEDDYKDDINARPLMTNYVGGGSPYMPKTEGLGVPIELAMAFHTDAGFTKDGTPTGSLGICTTDNEGKRTYPAGIHRLASRDLGEILLQGLRKDFKNQWKTDWAVRGIKDDNYGETRVPDVPSVILEMLSHQNFTDLSHALDPNFKFTFARSVYKSVLEYITSQHGEKTYTVQPLPPANFALSFGEKPHTVLLRWTPRKDPEESSATPTGYLVYTRKGDGDFDNGTYTQTPSLTIPIEPGIIYSFKITAANAGGESFPSETLSVCDNPHSKRKILIVNGFHRLSAPTLIRTGERQGVDLADDPGVPYLYSSGYCGFQRTFDRSTEGRLSPSGTGYTDNSLEGRIITGNTFDYPYLHGKAILAAGDYSFVSCSDEAVKNKLVSLKDYDMTDWIAGLQKYDRSGIKAYECFSPAARQALTAYSRQGGRLFVSGAYIGSGLTGEAEKHFTASVLKYKGEGSLRATSHTGLNGSGLSFDVVRKWGEKVYSISSSDCLTPVAPAFTTFSYTTPENQSASSAYLGMKFHCFSLGVPFEAISTEEERNEVMKTVMDFLFKKTKRIATE